MACIANATTELDEHEEIIVTPRMAKAGLAVFRGRDVYDVFLDEELEDFATRVYEAMANVRNE